MTEYDSGDQPEKPMFTFVEHELKLSRRKGFTLKELSIGNGLMVMGSSEGSIMKCTVEDNDSALEEIMIEQRVPVRSIFVDPLGCHVIFCMESGSCYYLHVSSNRPKRLSRAQNIRINCVAWDHQNQSENATSSILIGTDKGEVYEAVIDGKERVFRKVFELQNECSLSGLEFEYWHMPNGDIRYFIMLSTPAVGRTPTRLFQFLGGPNFESLFLSYSNVEKLRFQELPGEIANTPLRFFVRGAFDRAKNFSLLTGEGIYIGNFVFGTSSTLDNIVTGSSLLSYPDMQQKKGGQSRNISSSSPPIGLEATEYHCLILYNSKVQILNKLNGVLAFDEKLDSWHGIMKGCCRDVAQNTLWVYSDRRIYEVIVRGEDRDVWKLYAFKAQNGDERDFEVALTLCKTAQQRQHVLTSQADYYFKKNEYEQAALIYARTSRSFEEVVLLFMDSDQRDALKIFIRQKLKSLQPEDKTQFTVLCTWLVEIYLDKFNVLSDIDNVDQHANLIFEFKQFLGDHKQYLDPATTFHLISSHGRTDELMFFANLIEDYEKVITYHIQRADYDAAIGVLGTAPFAKVEQLYYKYSPILLQYNPEKTISSWKAAEGLDPTKLIPALVRCTHHSKDKSKRSGDELALDYLGFVTKNGNREPAIHNYLLSLYVKHPDERQLIKFLQRRHSGKFIFDLKYALRLCTKERKNRACIYIYSAMGLYEEAVDKALQVDVKIAKKMASQPEDDEMRRKLWLLIAKHTIDAGGDIKEAMSILNDSELLKIEDILGFFPDFVVIDDFKKEICESLEIYNDRIEQLKSEMRDYTESSELIRADMKRLRNRASYVTGNQRCDLTGASILSKEFYMFPCGHCFHASALRAEMMKHLNSFQRQTVKQLVRKLNELGAEKPAYQSISIGENSNEIPEREMVQTKLDEIVASECIFCGEVMIKSIGVPFITEEDEDREGSEWHI